MAETIRLTSGAERWTARIDADRVTVNGTSFVVRDEGDGRVRLEGPAGALVATAAMAAGAIWIGLDARAMEFRVARAGDTGRSGMRDEDALTPPMSATVVRIQVQPGDQVHPGDTLVVLEAMKMELPIRAPRAATVRAVHCAEGELVQPDQRLIELE
jgi:biotin carboxyl carrier protein